MKSARGANALPWICNSLLILAVFTSAYELIALRNEPARVEAPNSLPPNGAPKDRLDTTSLQELDNPLTAAQPAGVATSRVELIGIDRILNDPSSVTAYLFLASRRLSVNAYVGELIIDPGTGREVPELAGWRLKSATSSLAVFSTSEGEVRLELRSAALTAHDPRRSLLDEGARLYKQGRIAEAVAYWDKAIELHPTSSCIYDFIVSCGEDFFASMLNSKDERVRQLGYRLFELAKQGGERRRTADA